MSRSAAELKAEILRLTREFSRLAHAANRPGHAGAESPPAFTAGVTTVPYAGRVFTEDEVEAAVGATLDFWLTLGKEGEAMERELAEFLGVRHCLLVNSGSSANLIAVAALTSHKITAKRRLTPGDEVITCAAGFPTTVAPIVQNGLIPVFVDNDPITGNLRAEQLEAAYRPGKTKAVMVAHTLGNPFDLGVVLEFCHRHELFLVEDNCDALGCTYSLPLERARALGLDHLLKRAEANRTKDEGRRTNESSGATPPPSSFVFGLSSPAGPSSTPTLPAIIDGHLVAYTGSFGDLSTQSFYPPHHLTMGEGGAVNIIRAANLKTYAESFRDWGRDCWCPSGKDNTCCKRFDWKLGELPPGYDHKYIYSHLGYNVKPLDTQAAIGRVQLRRLPEFIQARKDNWEHLRAGLAGLESVFEFCLPTHATRWIPPAERHQARGARRETEGTSNREPQTANLESHFQWDSSGCRSDCSWFGFMLLVKPDAPFTRTELARHLEEKKIGNRMLFGGNLLRQPAFVQLRHERPDALRLLGEGAQQTKDEGRKTAESAPSSHLDPRTSLLAYSGADRLMSESLFIGTYPGLTPAMMDYEIAVIREFVASKSR